MIDEERDKDIENLFRNTLEGSEVSPGGDLEGKFMRRLERKEFMRFNPGRLNIFYLATAAAAAATISGLLIFSPPAETNHEPAGVKDSVSNSEMTASPENTRKSISDKPHTTTITDASENHVTGKPEEIVKEVPLESKNNIVEIHEVKTDIDKTDLVNNRSKEVITSGGANIPSVSCEASVTSGCVPLNVTFHSTASESCQTEWYFGDGGFSDEKSVSYIYDLPGIYDVSVTVTNAAGHKAVATMRIDVWPLPEASFELPETDVSDEGHVRFNNVSTGASSYKWYFGDGTTSESFEPMHKYNGYGKYDVTLVAVSSNGCTDSVSITDAFTDSGLFLRFPNAFTPNTGGPTGGYYSLKSDMNNQVFHPVSSGVVNYELKIFSKQGLLVFETDDLLEGWDGYYKGRLCSPGVYVWKVRGTYRNGAQIVMSGDVILLSY